MSTVPKPISVDLLVSESTSAGGLFGLYDTLASVGVGWETYVTGKPQTPYFSVRIVSAEKGPFRCASGVQVTPDSSVGEAKSADIVVVPGISVSASEPLGRPHPAMSDWLRGVHRGGARVASACTGALVLAEAGLLDDLEATTHWAWRDLFRLCYPRVRLRPEKSLCCSDARPDIVTAGGSTAWQELALFLITQHAGIEHAVRAAKFWLLPDQGKLQSPYMAMPLGIPHSDTAVRDCQVWLSEHYATRNPVAAMVERSSLPPTTFARRFRRATGYAPIDYAHAVRIEEAKQILETTDAKIERIGEEVGYEDPVSFRRLFKRKSGLTPAEYRRLFGHRRFQRYRLNRRSERYEPEPTRDPADVLVTPGLPLVGLPGEG
jgi:transcriptional regulator GlxA family with amidase domain